MKISVVTPSYNQAGFLEQTILSVLQQDYAEIEYLVVDGGSTDGSLDIIQNYANRVAWWVSERDSGQAEAINKGLSHASGEIVAWLNSDDLYLPNAVSLAVEALQSNPQAGMVFGNAITIDTKGRPLNSLVFGDWELSDLMAFRIICQPAVFMRRSVLEKAVSPTAEKIAVQSNQPIILDYLDPNLHFMLDHHLWLCMARQAPIQHIDRYLAAARHHPGAKNVAQAPGFGRETLLLLEWMEQEAQFASLVEENKRKIEGGAYRLNARYLLDGDQPGPALRWYLKALAASPAYTLRHWHRIFYALLNIVGLKSIANRIKSAWARSDIYPQNRISQTAPEIMNIYRRHPDWPGLNLEATSRLEVDSP